MINHTIIHTKYLYKKKITNIDVQIVSNVYSCILSDPFYKKLAFFLIVLLT